MLEFRNIEGRELIALTKEELLRYRNISAEIDLLKKQLESIEPEFTKDLVIGSDTEFPFTQHLIKISGYNIQSYEERIFTLKNKLNKKINELMEEKDRIMGYVCYVDDSRVRQILIYRYIEGLPWKAIGEKMNYGTSTIRLIHDSFMKKISTL